MRILIATPSYPPNIGGPATYSALLERELPSYGYEVSIADFRRSGRFPKIIRHAIYFFTVLKKGRNAHIIYALDPVSVGVPAACAAFLLRKRFMLRIAGDYAWEQFSGRYGTRESPLSFSKRYAEYPFIIRVFKEVQTEVARRAEKIVTPSRYLQDVIVQWGIPKEKIRVIHNTPEIPTRKDKGTLRGLLNFRGVLLMSAGRLIPLKGFDTLIDIVPLLKKTYPDLRLLIAGEGPLRSHLEEKIEKKGLEKDIILTGALKQDVLFGYLQASDIFILNSLHETFSHQVIEAMAAEIPVITTNAGGNPEIIESGKSGILVTHNNKKEIMGAIRRLLDDGSYRQKVISEAKKRISLFDRVSIIKQTAAELQ